MNRCEIERGTKTDISESTRRVSKRKKWSTPSKVIMIRNKSDRKSQEPYDFTYMWYIKLKATNDQIRKTKPKNS